jgi:hypothetical protein
MQYIGSSKRWRKRGNARCFIPTYCRRKKVTRTRLWFPTYIAYGFRMEMRSSSSSMNTIKFFVLALDSIALVSCVASMSDVRQCLAKICQPTVPALFRSPNEPFCRLTLIHVSKAKELFDVSDQPTYFFRVTSSRLEIFVKFQQKWPSSQA